MMQRSKLHMTAATGCLLALVQTAAAAIVVDDHFTNGNPLTNDQGGYVYDTLDPAKVSEVGGQLSMEHTFVSGLAMGFMVSNNAIGYSDVQNGAIQIELTIDSATLAGSSRVWVGLTGRPDLPQVFTNSNDSYVALLIQSGGTYRLIGNSNTGSSTIDDKFLLNGTETNWDPDAGLTLTMLFDMDGYSVSFGDGTMAQVGTWGGTEGEQDLLGLFMTNIGAGAPNEGAGLNNALVTPAFGVQASSAQTPAAVFSHFRVTVVPEPASVALMAMGGLVLLARRRTA